MIIRLTTFAAAAYLILQWDKRRRSQKHQPKAKPAAVSTWEGEGDALPTVGSQLGPAPAQS